jgi:DNA-binding MarR family transcriptional regulator
VFRTAKLEAILPALSQVGEALMADILKDLSKEDLRAVVESLGRIKATLVAMDGEIGID